MDNDKLFKFICDYLRQDYPKILEKNTKYLEIWRNEESYAIRIEIETGHVYTRAVNRNRRRFTGSQTDDIKILAQAFYYKHLKT